MHHDSIVKQYPVATCSDLEARIQLEELPIWSESRLEDLHRWPSNTQVVANQVVGLRGLTATPCLRLVVHVADGLAVPGETALGLRRVCGIRVPIWQEVVGRAADGTHRGVLVVAKVPLDPIFRGRGVIVYEQHDVTGRSLDGSVLCWHHSNFG